MLALLHTVNNKINEMAKTYTRAFLIISPTARSRNIMAYSIITKPEQIVKMQPLFFSSGMEEHSLTNVWKKIMHGLIPVGRLTANFNNNDKNRIE